MSASASVIVAEHFQLDRRRRPFEVADHVLQQLDELDFEEWGAGRQLLAQLVDDLFRRAAVAARFEPDENVSLVLLGGKQPEL